MEDDGAGIEGTGRNTRMMVVIGEKYCSEEERELTVRKTCVFYPGDGFAAYDRNTGELIFRVDTYGRGPSAFSDRQILLMDPFGDPILSVRRKLPSLHQRWEGFIGERKEGQKPLFSVRRSSIFGSDRRGGSISVELNGAAVTTTTDHVGDQYRIEGSFAQRCCRIVLGGEDCAEEIVVGEIKRKVEACAQVLLSKDVFSLCLKPGFDAAFAMGLVLVLDQISGEDDQQNDIDTAAVAPEDLIKAPISDNAALRSNSG